MKRLVVVGIVLSLVAVGCSSIVPHAVKGSGKVVSQSFDVSGFSEVELSTIGDVELVQGSEESLVIETDDNILPYLRVKVVNGKLLLDDEGNVMLLPSASIKFRLGAKDLKAITVSSSGSVSSESVTAGDFGLSLTGSGRIDLGDLHGGDCRISSDGSGRIAVKELECERVNVNMLASGAVELEGKTPSLTLESDGSGDALAGELNANDVTAKLTGSGNVTVWAVETLNAEVGGSGSLSYYGQPKVTSSVTGSGALNALGAH